MAYEIIVPVIGSSGTFELRPPLDTVIVANVRYTCQAVRSLSDYLANNEKPYETFYQPNGLTETDYDAHVKDNMLIVSLQSQTGHWLFVPASHISKYPIANGIPYRSITIATALPPLPVDRNLDFIHTSIRNLIHDSLGVDCAIKSVESSAVILISKEKHDIVSGQRAVITQGLVTDRARYNDLTIKHQEALNKIQELETYIRNQNGL